MSFSLDCYHLSEKSYVADSLAPVFALFFGRFVQGVANTIVGVLGLTHLTKNTSSTGAGKVYGVLTMSIAAGSSGGPLMAGALFDLAGYWTAWTSAFGASLLGVMLQSLMLVPPQESDIIDKLDRVRACFEEEPEEESPLLTPPPESGHLELPMHLRTAGLDFQFYVCLLTNRRYIGGLLSNLCHAIVSASFDTTLPLQVGKVFHWGSLETGILFAVLHGPNAFFSVPVKWLKDRVGSRYPTSVGFLALALLLWLAGTPGDDRFAWANLGYRGPVIYGASISAMGVFMSLLNGTGMIEAARK